LALNERVVESGLRHAVKGLRETYGVQLSATAVDEERKRLDEQYARVQEALGGSIRQRLG
jgi:hypothetical protein